MQRFLIFGGFMLVMICIIPLKRHLSEYDVQKHGQFVKAVITEVPNCFERRVKQRRVKHYIKFRYQKDIYSKMTTGKPCEEFKVGDTIVLKHGEATDIFLYDTETIESEFISFGVLGLAGIVFIILGLRMNNK